MSEYRVDAYFLPKEVIQNAVGSKNQELTANILNNPSNIIETFSGRFSGKKLMEAVQELVDNKIEQGFPFHYSFATWALIDTIANSRPQNPFIGYPFVDLYDFVEILENEQIYPNLKKVFEALNGMNSAFNLPINIGEWGQIPCIIYVELVEKNLADEAIQMKRDIENESEWTFESDDDLDDIEQVLDWIVEAHQQKKSLCLVMEGDL